MGRPSFVSAVRPVGFGLVGSMKTCRPLATTGCGCGCAARAPTATPIGVRVEVRYGGQKRFDQVVSGKGFLSQNPMTLHFGLGKVDEVDEVLVTWPGETDPTPVKSPDLIKIDQALPPVIGQPASKQ